MGRTVLRWTLFILFVLTVPLIIGTFYLLYRKLKKLTQSFEERFMQNEKRLDVVQRTTEDTVARVKRIEASTSKWEGVPEELGRLSTTLAGLQRDFLVFSRPGPGALPEPGV